MNTGFPEPLPPMDLTWIRWLLDSYAFWLKRELIDRTGTLEEQSERLYCSPFVVASHAKAQKTPSSITAIDRPSTCGKGPGMNLPRPRPLRD